MASLHHVPLPHPPSHHHRSLGGAHPPGLAELLDLDGEVLAPYLADAVAWIDRSLEITPRRILDLGTGTGTGAVALAMQFAEARVTAVDADPIMLTRVQAKIDEHGLADRVATQQLDLDAAALPAGQVDLVWMALALHELTAPTRLFDAVRSVLTPAGAFVVVEMDAPPRFLPDDLGLGRPGLETRCHAALAAKMGDMNAHPDWKPALEAAGFAVERHRIAVDLPAPVGARARRYAFTYLNRIRLVVEPLLDADDRSVLDTLLGDRPQGIRHRADLVMHGGRTAWLARPPRA